MPGGVWIYLSCIVGGLTLGSIVFALDEGCSILAAIGRGIGRVAAMFAALAVFAAVAYWIGHIVR